MQQPDAIITSSGFTSPLVAHVQDDPVAPDSDWLGASLPFSIRFSFPTPGGTLSGTQTFQVLLRKRTSEPAPDVAVSLYENGSLVRLLSTTSITSDSGQIITATFNASEITSAANVELLVSGVSSAVPWTPTALGANLVRFFHADDPALANDAAVSTWVDRTGTANVTGTTTTRPLYKTAGRNSQPTLFFDGVDDRLTGAQTGLPVTSAASTVLVVGFATNAAQFGHACSWGTMGNGLLRSAMYNFYGEYTSSIEGDDIPTVGSSWWGLDGIVVSSIGSGTMKVKVNGGTVVEDNAPSFTVNTGSGSLFIGCRVDTTSFWNGHLQCVIAINRFLDATETAKLEGWAAHEFGLTAVLLGGHPYKTVPPTV